MQATSPIQLTRDAITPKEAASQLGYNCTKSVLRLISTGQLSPVIRRNKRGIGAILIPQSTIEAFNAKRLVHTGAN